MNTENDIYECPIAVRDLRALRTVEGHLKKLTQAVAPFTSFEAALLFETMTEEEALSLLKKVFAGSEVSREDVHAKSFPIFMSFGPGNGEVTCAPGRVTLGGNLTLKEDGMTYVRVFTFYQSLNEAVMKNPLPFMKIFQGMILEGIMKKSKRVWKKEDLFLAEDEVKQALDPMSLLKLKSEFIKFKEAHDKFERKMKSDLPYVADFTEYEEALRKLKREFFSVRRAK